MRRPRAAKIVLAAALLTATPFGTAQELVVAAASSLSGVLEPIAEAFEARHDVHVALSFAGSSTLATQIVHGAQVDLFLSADAVQMNVVRDAGAVIGKPVPVARNRLVVAAAADGPVRTLEDLATPGVLVVLAAPEVPAGRYAHAAIAALRESRGDRLAAGILANVVSEEPNVRLALAKVILGEADAAFVYATDLRGADGVRRVDLPVGTVADATYLAAVIVGAADRDRAQAFVSFLTGREGRDLFARHGFDLPPNAGD